MGLFPITPKPHLNNEATSDQPLLNPFTCASRLIPAFQIVKIGDL